MYSLGWTTCTLFRGHTIRIVSTCFLQLFGLAMFFIEAREIKSKKYLKMQKLPCIEQRQLNMTIGEINLKTSIIIENTRNH